MATLINGNLNDPVYAAQDADLIAAICGNKTCIAPVGGEYAPTLEDANTIMVEDGVIITQEGRRIQLDAGDIDEFLIPTGSQGVTQYYICGYRLYTDEISAELCETFVEPVDSASETITEGTFRSGETEVYVSLLRVKQEGVNITEITELLSKSTDINQINNDLVYKKVNNWTKINQSPITLGGNTGAFDALSFKEFRFVVRPFGNTQFIMTNDVFKESINATYVFGFGGALNLSTPNGARAQIQVNANVGARNVYFPVCLYDGASASDATLDVYAR